MQGRADEAAIYLRWALKIRESTLGENHLRTALSLHALGNCFIQQAVAQHEKLHDARASFERALKIRRQHFGVEHFQTAISLNNVAVVLYQQQRVQVALDAFTKALEIKIRTVGYDNPSVADSLFNIGVVARDLCNADKRGGGGFLSDTPDADHEYNELALDCFMRSAEISRKALGPTHPTTCYASEKVAACMSTRERNIKIFAAEAVRNPRMEHEPKGADLASSGAPRRNGPSRPLSPTSTLRSEFLTSGKGGDVLIYCSPNHDKQIKTTVRPAGPRVATQRDGTRPPERRRPEEARASCDLEGQDLINIEEEDIMALVAEDGDEVSFSFKDRHSELSFTARTGRNSVNLAIPVVEQIIHTAATRPCKNTAAVGHNTSVIGHSAEILSNEQGGYLLILAGDDGFDDGSIWGWKK